MTDREALERIYRVIGPKVPTCCAGCRWEWMEALQIAQAALVGPAPTPDADMIARALLAGYGGRTVSDYLTVKDDAACDLIAAALAAALAVPPRR